jgi:protein-S-isoprenylcysteine O-methyltransferase Ste14
MNTQPPAQEPLTPEVRRRIRRWIVQAALGTVGYALILFLSAGRWDWLRGWVLLGVLVAVMAAPPLLLLPICPELLAERQRGFWVAGAKGWDKWITTAAGGLMFAPWIVAGLDVRFGWTGPLPLGVHLGGLGLVLLGYGLFLWAMAANAFFAEAARIQAERGHTPATGGPYRYVRHPGYLGTIVAALGTPLLLGSPWALIPAGLFAALWVLRTALEDRMLRQELPGYADYAQQAHFRLVPGVW